MNHIYKSIFNKALGVFTAVPEFASAHGKGSERTVVGRVAKGTAGFAASALAISIGLALTSTSAVAGPGIYINDGKSDDGCIAIPDASGPNVGIYGISNTGGGVGVAILAPGQVALNKDYFAMNAMAPCLSSGNVAQAFDTQTNRTLFYGNDSYGNGTITNNGAKNLTLGGRLDVNSGIIGVGDRGVNGLDATNSIRMGMGTALSDDNKKTDAVTIGVNAGASAKHATAIGSATTAKTGYSTALGFQSQAGDPAVTNFNGEYATAIGGKAKALHAYTTALGAETNASGAYATAVGNEAKATHESTTAVGKGAKATNDFATAVGQLALASGKNGTAVGTRNEALGEEATALGYHSHANGSQQLSIGAHAGRNLDGSFSQSTHGISIGSLAGADNATAKSNDDSVLIGTESGRYAQGGDRNTSIGKSAGQYLKGNDNIAMGSNAGSGTATDKLEVSNTVAIGNTAKASGNDGIALGNTANSKTDGAISIGTRSVSGDGDAVPGVTPIGNKSISIGYESVANRYDTIAMGVESSTQAADPAVAPWDAVAIGSKSKATTYKALAIGAYSQATGRQSTVIGNDIQGQNSTASGTRSQILGVQSNVSGDNSVSIGDTNTVASVRTYAMGNNISVSANASDSLALGSAVKVDGDSAIALGKNAAAAGNNQIAIGVNAARNTTGGANHSSVYSVAIGTNAGADNVSTAQDGNTEGVAIGYNAGRHVGTGIHNSAIGLNSGMYIQGSDNIAFGSNAGSGQKDAVLDINRTVAIGANALSSKNNAVSIGGNSKAQDISSVAIGDTATAANANSVALGARSTTSDVHTGDYTLNNSYTAAGLPNAANGTVSVGSAGKERQIQNVAAGVISATSTDAINGSQLYATNNYLSNLAGGVKNVLGGDAAVDNAGNLTMSNIGGTGKGNVNDAIAAANTKVAAGDNITVTPTTNADGSKTYTVATKKDLVVDSVKAGDTTVNTDGVTIANGPSITKSGINANGRKVTGLVDGDINATSTDAVNGSQLHATNTKLADVENTANTAVQEIESANPDALSVKKDGTKVTLTPNVIAGDLVDPATGAVNTPAAGDAGKLVTAGTVANALANTHFVVDTKATDGELDTASQADQKIKSGNKVTLQAGKNLKAKQTNGANGAEVEFSLKDSISLTQVTAGTGANQVVLGNDGVKVGGKTYINNDGLNANGNKITNVANGVAPTDAVNKGQLDTVNTEAQKHTTVKAGKNVEVSEGTNAAGGKEYTVKTADNLDVTSVKAGDTTVNTDGVTITGGPSVKKDGINAGDKKITGVADGNVAAGSTDAVNGGQLAEVKSKADSAVQNVVSANPTALTANKVGDTVTLTPNFIAGDLVNADGTVNTPAAADEGKLVSAKAVADALKANHFVVDTKANGGKTEAGSEADAKVGSSNKVTFEAGKNLIAKQANTANGGATVKFSLQDDISLNSVTAGAGDNQVVLNDAGVNVGNKNYINKDGLNANGNKVANVKAGDVSATSTDAVNGAQLHNVATSVANVLGGNAAVDGNGNVTSSDIGGTGANTVDDAIKAVNATAAKHTTVVEGKNVKVTKGKNAAGGDEYTVATKDDLDVTSVTAGNTTVNTNGLTITGGPSVTRGGIDAGNRVISGVKAGDVSATSQEAVNGSQLHATNTKLDGVKAKADTAVQDVKSGDENALTAVKDPNTNIVTVTPKLSGDLVDANGNITAPATPADKGKLVTAGTVAQALANTHFVVDTAKTNGELDTASEHDQKIKAGNKVTLQAGKNLKAKQTNGANGAQVEFSLKDSISLKEVTAGEGANQVVLGNDGVKVGGNTYINNNGLNANGNKITNVADGVDPTDAVNKGQLDAVKGVADSAVKSVKAADGEENLVVDNTDPKNPKLSLKKDLTVDSVKAGDSTLNNDGLTIAGGPSVKKDGINAGDKTITNVAPGAVTAASKDAVNGGQLYNVANNVKDLIGPDAKIDPATGKVAVADPAKGIGETGKGNIGDAIKHVNDAAKAAADTAKKHTTVEQGDNIVVEESTNANGGKHYKVSTAKDLNVDSVKAGDTTVNNDGVTIAGGPSVTKAGINAGGNTITNVADGVNPNDAVNKGQLDAVKGVADSAVKSVDVANGEQNLVVDNSDPKNPKLSLKKDLTVDSVKAGDSTLNNDGLTIAGGPSVKKDGIDAADKKITNVAAGDVAENSKDAVNGGQLYDVAKNVADLVGPDAKIDPATGKVTVTDPAKGIGETGKGNIGDAIKHVNDLAKNAADTAKKHTTVEQGDNIVVEESTNADGGKHYKVSTAKDLNVDSVKAGDTTVNNDGVTIAGGPSVTKGGINAGGNTITNVADGVNPNDAVNKGQLDKVDTKVSNVAQNVVNVLGGDAAVNGNGDITMSNIGETGKGNINDAIKSVNDLAKKAAAEKTSVKAKEGRSNVTVTEGVNAAGGHEYTVDVERSVTNAGSDYVTVTNNHDADSNTTTYTVDVSAKTKASLAKADSAVQGLTSKDGNLNFTKGANGNVEVSFNDNLNVKNVTTDRVQVANGPSMSKDGINAAGKAISNVANGNVAADSKDAVNGGQLHETAKSVADVIGGGATVKDGKVVAGQNGIGNTGQNTVHGAIAAINQNTANNFNQIRGDLRKMDRDLRGGIAGALATAGLPQAFRPGKSMVAAAASTYRGQSGLAIGVSRISDNGKVILKVTGNTNSRGDFGGTIGAGYQW